MTLGESAKEKIQQVLSTICSKGEINIILRAYEGASRKTAQKEANSQSKLFRIIECSIPTLKLL